MTKTFLYPAIPAILKMFDNLFWMSDFSIAYGSNTICLYIINDEKKSFFCKIFFYDLFLF